MIKLETKLSVPSSDCVFTFIGPHTLTSGRVFHSYITKRPQNRQKRVCVCVLLDFELLLLLKQNLFSPWVFIFFFSLFILKMRKPQLTLYLGVCLSKIDSMGSIW